MFRHLLVPLDGSPLAEAAAPAARCLLETLGAEVTLLHMVERNAPRAVHGQSHLATSSDAEAYLAELAGRVLPHGSQVGMHVHADKIDDVAAGIVAHAEELGVDLIVLTTHGASGVRHGLFGTVAQRVIALGATPVLLVPTPPPENAHGFSCRRAVAPLDGNPDHEHGLSALANLAPASTTHVLLLMVIPPWYDLKQSQLVTSRMLPGTTVELLDASCDPAQAYLDEKAADLKRLGCDVTTRVVRGEPVAAIAAASRDFAADLIVLGTHGKKHLDAFWSESLTPQLARKSQAALLLAPVHDG